MNGFLFSVIGYTIVRLILFYLFERKDTMGKTSTKVKQRYLNKTYVTWSVRLRPEDFSRVEAARGDLWRRDDMILLTGGAKR